MNCYVCVQTKNSAKIVQSSLVYTSKNDFETQFYKWKGMLVLVGIFNCDRQIHWETFDRGKVQSLALAFRKKKLLKAGLWFWIPNQFHVIENLKV